jgi:hypothetical protein
VVDGVTADGDGAVVLHHAWPNQTLEIDRVPAYLPVASDGGRRAAELIADVL